MTDPSSPNDPLKDAWRSQPVELTKMTAMELAAAATKFERKINRRNLIEYVAGAVAILAFSAEGVFLFREWVARTGAALIIVGLVFILWQLHLRASPRRAPAEGSPESLMTFQRAQLVRQRDALRWVPVWYILPVVPGMIVMGVGVGTHPRPGMSLQHSLVGMAASWTVVGLVFVIIWLLNALGAAKLDREIDKIDRMQGG